jgi:hypothetical protein
MLNPEQAHRFLLLTLISASGHSGKQLFMKCQMFENSI